MDRVELLRNLKQLVELDRDFGVEFTVRQQRETPSSELRAPSENRVQQASRTVQSPVIAYEPICKTVSTPVSDPTWSAMSAPDALASIVTTVAACTRCALRAGCARTVPGEGSSTAELMFIGEGPGADEDALGRPFVGAAGQLLDKMIVAMGLRREDVFIANIVKCRPPGNRTPSPDEVAACMPYLQAQIAALKPKVICTLGNTPLRALMNDENLGITRLRGSQLKYQGIVLIPTFHPSYLLRNPAAKKPCWEDLRVVLHALGKSVPSK